MMKKNNFRAPIGMPDDRYVTTSIPPFLFKSMFASCLSAFWEWLQLYGVLAHVHVFSV